MGLLVSQPRGCCPGDIGVCPRGRAPPGCRWGLAEGTEHLLCTQLLSRQLPRFGPCQVDERTRTEPFLSLSKQLLFGPGAGQGSWAYLMGAEGSWGFTSFSPSCVTRASVRGRGDAAANGCGVNPVRCLWARCGAASAGLRALLTQMAVRLGEAQLPRAAQQLVGRAGPC